MLPARHSLVWLTGAGWQQVRAHVGEEWRPVIGQWQHGDWPAVMRRSDAGTAVDQLCVGLAPAPDPADGTKKRLPLRIDASHVRKMEAPLPLAAAIACAPAGWRDALAALDAAAEREDIHLRVYGSLALQTLTGLSYLRPESDIDLLFQPATRRQLAAGIRLLSHYACHLPLDGEIVFPAGDAVAWKEWANAIAADSKPRVLVKSGRGVCLATMETLLAQWRDDDA